MAACMESISFCNEASALVDVWEKLPKAPNMYYPAKTSFSPSSLGKYLRSVFLLEYINDSDIRARVAGTSLREFLGVEITGQNVLDLYPNEFLDNMKSFYSALRTKPCAGYVERPYKMGNENVRIMKSLILPMANTSGDAVYYVGVAKPYHLPDGGAHLKAMNWVSERDMTIRYSDVGGGVPV